MWSSGNLLNLINKSFSREVISEIIYFMHSCSVTNSAAIISCFLSFWSFLLWHVWPILLPRIEPATLRRRLFMNATVARFSNVPSQKFQSRLGDFGRKEIREEKKKIERKGKKRENRIFIQSIFSEWRRLSRWDWFENKFDFRMILFFFFFFFCRKTSSKTFLCCTPEKKCRKGISRDFFPNDLFPTFIQKHLQQQLGQEFKTRGRQSTEVAFALLNQLPQV